MNGDRPTPSERLAASRERLRLALAAMPAPVAAGHRAGPVPPWIEALKSSNPGAAGAIDAVSIWWDQHPLRLGLTAAGAAISALIQPVARRHPFALLLGAGLLGGLLVCVRPWRWRLPPAILEGLLPGLAAHAVTHAPIQSWLAALVQAPMPGVSTLDVPLPEVPLPDAPLPDGSPASGP